MKQALVRLYEELNEYLPAEKRKRTWPCVFQGEISVATLLRALGVPLAEVDLILIGGESVGPSRPLHDGDRVSVYPVFESLDIKDAVRVREEPLRRPSFIAACGLERLAVYLRLMGFDVLTISSSCPEDGIRRAEAEHRTVLSRADRPAPSNSHFFRVRSRKPRFQAKEVIGRLDLRRLIKPLSRCPRCSTSIGGGEFLQCQRCALTYSEGIHLQRIRWLVRILSGMGNGS